MIAMAGWLFVIILVAAFILGFVVARVARF